MIAVTGGSHVISAPVVLGRQPHREQQRDADLRRGQQHHEHRKRRPDASRPGAVVLGASNAFGGATHLGANAPTLVIANPLALQNSTLDTGLY